MLLTMDEALTLCQEECRHIEDPLGWTLARAREIDGGSDESVWQAIREHHTDACIGRAVILSGLTPAQLP